MTYRRTAHKLRHICNLHIKETGIYQKRAKGMKNWKITYSVILSVFFSNKTNLILGFISPLRKFISHSHTFSLLDFVSYIYISQRTESLILNPCVFICLFFANIECFEIHLCLFWYSSVYFSRSNIWIYKGTVQIYTQIWCKYRICQMWTNLHEFVIPSATSGYFQNSDFRSKFYQ